MAAVPRPAAVPAPNGDRIALWLLLLLTTALDVALLRVIGDTYGSSALYWLFRKLRSDPVVAWLALDAAALRLTMFLLGARLMPRRPLAASALLLVPVAGAPLAMLALLGHRDADPIG